MPWAGLDDRLYRNRKIRGLSDKAFRLYICSISYAADHLTDGYLDKLAVADLQAVSGALRKQVSELLENELWDLAAQGYLIHDYLHYNPSREQVLQRREQGRIRKERMRARASENGVPNGVPADVPERRSERRSEREPERVPERVAERYTPPLESQSRSKTSRGAPTGKLGFQPPTVHLKDIP